MLLNEEQIRKSAKDCHYIFSEKVFDEVKIIGNAISKAQLRKVIEEISKLPMGDGVYLVPESLLEQWEREL